MRSKQFLKSTSNFAYPFEDRNIQNVIFYICIFICFSSILILNYLFPVFGDDWVYTFVFRSDPPIHITNLKEIIYSQYTHYLTWGGRFVTHFIAQFLLMLEPWVQNLMNAFVFTVFIYLIFKISNYNKKLNPALFIFIYSLIWFFQPAFGATILWITGSSNYLWSTTIILLFIYPYYIFFRCPQYNPKGIFTCICFFIGGILAGWTNENMSVAVVLMLLLICGYFKKRGRLPKWATIGFIGFCFGCALLLAAPGNYVRLDTINENIRSIEMADIFKSRFYTMLYHYFYHILLLTIIYIIGLIIFIKIKDKKDKNCRTAISISLIFIITGHIAFAAMIMSPQFPDRALFGTITFTIIAICILYTNIGIPNIYVKVLKRLGVILLIVILSYDYYSRYKVLCYAHNMWEKRYAYVIQQVEKGNLDIELKEEIIIEPKYFLHELSPDPNIWYNKAFSKYMGINSVKVIE
ncbi:DUF6056 family protein [Prevotella sp. 10(H)]|uniref:DUF3329 domain-containing protein n=1 Tax=Prevotella sp. 10(H) TaxID=1158294 RepID=UPI00056226DE|nr:DUF6056 family protein [Prevotella sp. 10(H)]